MGLIVWRGSGDSKKKSVARHTGTRLFRSRGGGVDSAGVSPIESLSYGAFGTGIQRFSAPLSATGSA